MVKHKAEHKAVSTGRSNAVKIENAMRVIARVARGVEHVCASCDGLSCSQCPASFVIENTALRGRYGETGTGCLVRAAINRRVIA